MNRAWLKAWIAALLACALLAGSYESILRHRGYLITVQDDADLWSMQLDRVRHSSRAVALLGASRIEFGVDPALLSRKLGGRPVAMLAINGRYPMAALRALADDDSFTGLAVVGVDARGLQRKHWDMQQSYFDHYRHRWTLARWIHRKLLTVLQEHLVFVRSAFAATGIVERWIAGEGPPMNDHVVVRADRAGFIDYHRPDLPGIRASRIADLARYYREEPPTDAKTWLNDLAAVSRWVERIQKRGGRVVFFREPAADESLALDEANFPRDRYWDVYARQSPAPMIDFRDVPEMATFVLPDTSHIDGTEVPRFTTALAHLLQSRKLVD
ncbi:MAG: hypothetical protein ACREYB_06545 [Casimicrobiaceae bacterium]